MTVIRIRTYYLQLFISKRLHLHFLLAQLKHHLMSNFFSIMFFSSTTSPNNWGYEVIEHLIEEEQQTSNKTTKRPKPSKKPKLLIRVEDSNENGESKEQSGEKPLRMYFNVKSEEEEKSAKSIENYIDAKLSNSDETDTHEEHLKRRNSMEAESEERRPQTKDTSRKTNGEQRLKSDRHNEGRQGSNTPITKESHRHSKNRGQPMYQQKYLHDKTSWENIPSKHLEESIEVRNKPSVFHSSEPSSFENDPGIHALVEDVLPNYQLGDTGSMGHSDLSQRPLSIPQPIVSSVLDKRKPLGDHLSRPYQINLVPNQLSQDEYSFQMVTNTDPSSPILYKTKIMQKHAPLLDHHKVFKQFKGKTESGKNCKPGYGKSYNSILCSMSESLTTAPVAISYQQQEFYRSSPRN